MLNKFIRKISFLLLLTLIVQIINPLISLAANPSEKFNGEDILFKYDGYIYTSPEENDTITVKAYKDDGTLIEEISVDKNQKNKAVRLDYTVTIDMEPVKTIINFEDYDVTEETIFIDDDITQGDNEDNHSEVYNPAGFGRHTLGVSTLKAQDWLYTFTGMRVTYDEEIKQTTKRIRNWTGTIAELTLYLITLLVIPKWVGSELIKQLITDGIVIVLEGTVINANFSLAALKTTRTFWGQDINVENMYGRIDGTKTVINETDHKYVGETYYEGVYHEPSSWGDLSISNSLIPSVYGALTSKLTLISE